MEIRSKENVKNHGEVFTPLHIVDEMLDLFPQEVWEDPSYIFLEPTCGNGNFLKKIAVKRFHHGISPIETLNTLIGLDISKENIFDSRCYLARVYGWMLLKNDVKVNSRDWMRAVVYAMAVLKNNFLVVDDSLKVIKEYPNGLLGEMKFVENDPTGHKDVMTTKERNDLLKKCISIYKQQDHPITKEFYHHVRN